MYIVHVEVEVHTNTLFENPDQLIEFIKKHLGGYYNDHDIAKITRIITIQKKPQ